MLCHILGKNINIRANVEDQLINYYSQCLLLDRGRSSFQKRNSLGSCKGKKSKPLVYTYVSAFVIFRLKALAFEAKKRLYENKIAMNWDSLNTSLVNQSALEHNLENSLKVVILDSGYSKEEMVYRLANKLYSKFRCRVRDTQIDFKDLENDIIFFSYRLNALHKIEPEGDSIIKLNYRSLTICLILPNKIERYYYPFII